MALEDYTLSTIRSRIAEEFGKDSTDTNFKTRVNNRINDAQLWVTKARPNWPWLLKELVIDISPLDDITDTADFTKGSTTVANVGLALQERDIISAESAVGVVTSGYMVTSFAGNTATLQSQYRGDTASSADVSVSYGYFQLPSDFLRLEEVEEVDSLTSTSLIYKSPMEFEKIKRKGSLAGINTTYYTVKPDPLTTVGNMYLSVFPYQTVAKTYQGNYWMDPPKLVNDTDVPTVPRVDRTTLLDTSYWFVSTLLKLDADRINFYRAQALDSLQRMQAQWDLSSEPNLMDQGLLEPGFIQGPAGYPRFSLEN